MKRYQSGIVLISCILFLIIILITLKVVLTTSQISEKRAGIDQDVSLAQESAQLALRMAEKKIISVIDKQKLSACKNKKDKPCQLLFRQAIELVWYEAWPDTSSNNEMAKRFAKLPKDDQKVIKDAANKIKSTVGFYSANDNTCVNNVKTCLENNSKSISIDISNLDHKYDISSHYVVTRFLPKDLGMSEPEANIIFRITAIGYGQSGGGGEKSDNTTSAIYQANYML